MSSRCTYILTRNTYYLNGESFDRYGIAIMENASKAIIRTVSDLCCKRDPVSDLVAVCNRLKLDPEQLDDVVHDFLG